MRFDLEPVGTQSKILAAIEAAGKPDLGGYDGDAHRAASLITEHWHDGEETIVRWLADSEPTSADTPGKPLKPPRTGPETAQRGWRY